MEGLGRITQDNDRLAFLTKIEAKGRNRKGLKWNADILGIEMQRKNKRRWEILLKKNLIFATRKITDAGRRAGASSK